MSVSVFFEQVHMIMNDAIKTGINDTIFAPLDRVKLLLQLQGGFTQKDSFPKYTGIVQTFRSVIQEQGSLSLWRGNLAKIAIFFPAQFASLTSMYMIRPLISLFSGESGHDENFNRMVYSFAGLAASTLASHPFQIAWIKIATDISPTRQCGSIGTVISDIYKTTGLRSLYYGYFTMMMGKIIYRPVQVGLYFSFKDMVLDRSSSFFQQFLYSQCITILCGLAIYPFDTVSKRLMLQAGGENSLSTVALIKHIYQNEGKFVGFYRGWMCTLISSLANALLLTAYDVYT